jgi:hypothetical protein
MKRVRVQRQKILHKRDVNMERYGCGIWGFYGDMRTVTGTSTFSRHLSQKYTICTLVQVPDTGRMIHGTFTVLDTGSSEYLPGTVVPGTNHEIRIPLLCTPSTRQRSTCHMSHT